MEWGEVFHTWTFLASFFFVFIVHNTLIAPILLQDKRHLLYGMMVVILIMFTFAVQHAVGPSRFSAPQAPPPPSRNDDRRPPDEPHDPPRDLWREDISIVLGYILIIGMNIGVKLYFRSEQNEAMKRLLERKSLEQQMEYLKYQVNPHFFMNTLNNIHALIDIDPPKAKSSVIELSKMMRYVLYEGSRKYITLKKEIEFLRSYVDLMAMRYHGRVRIERDLPSSVPERLIPPLLLIIFVENAFKHGISYKEESFMRISIHLDEECLSFRCTNSKFPHAAGGRVGVGLANVRKRLAMLYGDKCSLVIENGEKIFDVQLRIPFAEKPSDAAVMQGEVKLPLE